METTNKEFKHENYAKIRKFLLSNGMRPLKDSNYVSTRKLSERQIDRIENHLVRQIPEVGICLTKFDWAVYRPELINHSVIWIKRASRNEFNKNHQKEKDNNIDQSRGRNR
ncbi:MAG: hypothetical protein LBL60_01320 [Mycoplasmataceae bacterium]|nr:hypothetical protein [Mycoplasmataceae bacterium]